MEGDNFSVFGNGTQVDSKVFQSFQKSFLQVQSILDQNRLLINEINQNHESKIPDSLSRNVGLIRELNNNIRRVVDLYADLSLSFTKSVEASSEWSSAVRQPNHKRSRPEHSVSCYYCPLMLRVLVCIYHSKDSEPCGDSGATVAAGGAGDSHLRFLSAEEKLENDSSEYDQYGNQDSYSELLKQVIFSKHALVNMLVTYWSHFLDGTDEYLKSILYSTILCHSSSRNNCKVFKELECADDKLKKMALRVIAESLSEEEIAGLKEAIPCDGHQQQQLVNDEIIAITIQYEVASWWIYNDFNPILGILGKARDTGDGHGVAPGVGIFEEDYIAAVSIAAVHEEAVIEAEESEFKWIDGEGRVEITAGHVDVPQRTAVGDVTEVAHHHLEHWNPPHPLVQCLIHFHVPNAAVSLNLWKIKHYTKRRTNIKRSN
ncbi:hypothetical protein ZIOFF_056736 [Zingiber officinale]|uniref:Protein EARLY FLOWERING 4 domain-containing protein n=1 Tax=Zingiber officinale TaxID=94328 RepID=A0A8J5FP13_ZINOF|nr:hypothetical protein ZIOFF_056736 [Zingiber officinale]